MSGCKNYLFSTKESDSMSNLTGVFLKQGGMPEFGGFWRDIWGICGGDLEDLWRKFAGKLEDIKRRLERKNLFFKKLDFLSSLFLKSHCSKSKIFPDPG